MTYHNLTHNEGYIMESLPPSLFSYFSNISESQRGATMANSSLVGNIEEEYFLQLSSEKHKLFEDYLWGLADRYNEHTGYEERHFGNLSTLPKELDKIWVNFQKKHEFNPLHQHEGIYSFVIWLNIPYDLEDETAQPHTINSPVSLAGSFTFVYAESNSLKLKTHVLPLDKKSTGSICFFPAYLSHCAYPYSTSNEERISISGNIQYVAPSW